MMNLVRSMAVGISHRVVRWAAPGCKDWAEGLAREVEFIESDWRALAWAIGSTRVLLEREEAPIDSLGKAVVEANYYFDKRRDGIQALYFGAGLLSVFVGLVLLKILHSFGRVCDAVVLSGLLFGIHSLYGKEMRKIGQSLDPYELTARYREKLQRADAAQRGWLSCLLSAAVILQPFAFTIYESVKSHEWIGLPILAIYAPCVLVLEAWNSVKRRRIRRRIADLDSLLAMNEGGASI